MYQVDEKLKAIVAQARKRGFLTYHQVNAHLPDEGGDSAMVDQLVLALEETGLDLVEDPDLPEPVGPEGSTSAGADAQLARSLIGPE